MTDQKHLHLPGGVTTKSREIGRFPPSPQPSPLYGPTPVCKVFPPMTGTGLLPYIRPVDEASVVASGPDGFRTHRPYLKGGFIMSPGRGRVPDAPFVLWCHHVEEDLRNRFRGKPMFVLFHLADSARRKVGRSPNEEAQQPKCLTKPRSRSPRPALPGFAENIRPWPPAAGSNARHGAG